MNTAILTDSTCDLPAAQAQALGLEVIPLTVNMRGAQLRDWQDIEPDAVYDFMRSGGAISTVPVTQAQFEHKYRSLLASHERIFSVHLSGKLSETVRYARAAARNIGAEDRIFVIDAGVVGYPVTDAALTARQAAEAGADAATVEKAVEQWRQSMLAELSVPTLEYLRRSGRVSRMQELVGNALNLRPVLRFVDGGLAVNRRVRGEKALADMLEHLHQQFGQSPVNVVVAYAGRDPVRFTQLRAAVKKSELEVAQGRMQIMGPVVGAHVGPEAYSLMAYPV